MIENQAKQAEERFLGCRVAATCRDLGQLQAGLGWIEKPNAAIFITIGAIGWRRKKIITRRIHKIII